MSRRTGKIVIVVVVVVIILLVMAGIVFKIFAYCMQASMEHKSAHTGGGTVVSIARSVPRKSPATAPSRGQYTVCFTLDDWGKVRDDPRYETAERERERSSGPRCEAFDSMLGVSKLKPGDKIQIVYMLENDFHIDIASINAFGVDLVPK